MPEGLDWSSSSTSFTSKQRIPRAGGIDILLGQLHCRSGASLPLGASPPVSAMPQPMVIGLACALAAPAKPVAVPADSERIESATLDAHWNVLPRRVFIDVILTRRMEGTQPMAMPKLPAGRRLPLRPRALQAPRAALAGGGLPLPRLPAHDGQRLFNKTSWSCRKAVSR